MGSLYFSLSIVEVRSFVFFIFREIGLWIVFIGYLVLGRLKINLGVWLRWWIDNNLVEVYSNYIWFDNFVDDYRDKEFVIWD